MKAWKRCDSNLGFSAFESNSCAALSVLAWLIWSEPGAARRSWEPQRSAPGCVVWAFQAGGVAK